MYILIFIERQRTIQIYFLSHELELRGDREQRICIFISYCKVERRQRKNVCHFLSHELKWRDGREKYMRVFFYRKYCPRIMHMYISLPSPNLNFWQRKYICIRLWNICIFLCHLSSLIDGNEKYICICSFVSQL